jgi:hypothetical protein
MTPCAWSGVRFTPERNTSYISLASAAERIVAVSTPQAQVDRGQFPMARIRGPPVCGAPRTCFLPATPAFGHFTRVD